MTKIIFGLTSDESNRLQRNKVPKSASKYFCLKIISKFLL
jgi:hypothetical protein